MTWIFRDALTVQMFDWHVDLCVENGRNNEETCTLDALVADNNSFQGKLRKHHFTTISGPPNSTSLSFSTSSSFSVAMKDISSVHSYHSSRHSLNGSKCMSFRM